MTAPTFVSGSANAAASGSVTVTAPASIVSGNTLIAVLYDASSSSPSYTVPSGFTLAFGASTVSTRGTISIYIKTATGSEPGSYAFSGGHFVSAAVLQYTSCSLDGTPTTNTGSSTSAVAPTITPTDPSDVLLCVWGGFTGITVSADPASMTRRAAASNSGNTSVTVDEETLSSTSATGTRTATMTTSSNYYAVSVLLKGPATPGVVSIPAATATASAPAPTVELDVNLPAATATGDAPAPDVTQSLHIDLPAASATADAPAPDVVLYTDLTSWRGDESQASSIGITGGAVLTLDVPPIAPPPDEGWTRKSSIYDPPTVVDGLPVDWEPVDYIEEDLGQLQVVIGGRDVSVIRGQRTQVLGWSSREPNGDSVATLRIPQLTVFDHPGSGDFAWLVRGAHVELRQISPLGVVHVLWTGKYMVGASETTSTGWAVTLTCSGALYDADRAVQPAGVRNDSRDIGTVIPESLNSVISRDYATLAPVVTGITTRAKGPAPHRLTDFIDPIFATATTSNGLDQWTLTNVRWKPVMKLKDHSTVHATMRAGQPGCKLNLQADGLSGTTVIYGEGTRADGMRFRNMKFPGVHLDDAPLFPLDPSSWFAPGSGTTGFAAFAEEMRTHGYTMHSGDTYDARDEDEVRDAQARGGILIDGLVGPQTWATTFAVGSNIGDLYSAYQAPMAIIREVEPWTYNARGEKTGNNPFYDPGILRVEKYEDFGEGSSLALARSSARGELNRTWLPQPYGTVTLTEDPNEISRFKLKAGMNLLLQQYHQIDRMLHIAGADIDWKAQSVTLTVDVLNRDLLLLQEIRKRNRDNTSPAGKASNSRSGQLIDTYTIWDGEAPTGIIPRHAVIAGLWFVLKIPAGQVGNIASFHMTASGPASEFALGVFGRPVTASQLQRLVGSPFDEARPWDTNIDALRDLGIVAAWGGQDNPCGYGEKAKTDDGATLTGKFVDDGGFSYSTDYPGSLWVAEYVATSCYLEGRMTPGVEGL